jgi:hypothetical protein
MKFKKKAKKAAEKGSELWVAKKGIGLTASLLKWGAIAGVVYLGYKLYKENQE